MSLLKNSRQSAFTTLLGRQSSVSPAAKTAQQDSRAPRESVYERLYAQGAVRKRTEPQHNNSMRPRTPKEIPVQLTEPTLSQQAARKALQQKCQEEIENELREQLRRP